MAGGGIPYTICFIRQGDDVLMLLRDRPPNAGLWNGIGGKISPGETPAECARREVLEEAGVDLGPEELRFGGLVRWSAGVDPTGPSTGMYAFVADLPHASGWDGERRIAEGLISWKPLAWACDPENTAVVSNVPRFLPGLLGEVGPAEYRCEYVRGALVGFSVHKL
jgi:8-oxo-dGTP diphosphatase